MAIMAATLTRADLDALPDDGLRQELIDGSFVMTPAPGFAHQHVALTLYRLLSDAARGSGLYVMAAPFDVVLGANVVKPGIFVAPHAAFTERDLPTAPLLVVEVRSPATGWLDQGRKRQLYADAGVAHYWLVDPLVPTIDLLRMESGEYVQVARVAGSEPVTITEPFPLALAASQFRID